MIAYVALWIFIFALPWENSIVVAGVGTISRLMGMLALGFAVLAAVMTGRLRSWRLFHVVALLFVVWSGWSMYRQEIYLLGDSMATISKFRTYLQLFLVLWMIWELAPSLHRLHGLMLAYVLGSIVASVNTLLVFRAQAAVLSRFAAAGFDPNDLAMTLALALPMAWYLGLSYPHVLVRWVCRGYIPLGLLAIGLTGSRGGLVASVVALLVIPFTFSKLSSAKIVAVCVLLAASGGLGIAFIPTTTLQRLGTTSTEAGVGTLNGRLLIWKAGVEALARRPVIGYGTGGFERAVRPFLGHGRAPHNSYLGVLVEQGVLGFILFALMFIAVIRQNLALPRLERRFAQVLLATLCVAMLPLTWDDRKPVWFILALLAALGEAFSASRAGQLPVNPPPPVPHARVRLGLRGDPLYGRLARPPQADA